MILRKAMLLKRFCTTTKFQTFCLIFSVFGMLHIMSSISELKILQLKSSSPVTTVVKSGNNPVYWLSANNADSGYMNHVKETFKAVGFDRWNEKSGDWDVMWSYEYPFGKAITSTTLKPHQKVNHFPGSGYLTSKGYLAMSKSRYIPLAFSLPQNLTDFKKYIEKHPEKMWVQKNNKHRGIKIKTKKELDFSAPDSFIQEFVRKPFLVDRRKFDVGIYTVITSINPLTVYVLDNEWLIRFCPEDYEPFDSGNVRKYVVEDDYTPTWEMPSLKTGYKNMKLSHKESLLQHLKTIGLNEKKVVDDLYAAVSELIWEKQPDIIRSVGYYPYGTRSFFELVRFDFVLDEDLNVYAMEVNMSPNLSSGHFADNARMYRQVIFNTLSLVGIAMQREHSATKNIFEEEMSVSNRDIVAYPEECLKCKYCLDHICKLCSQCMVIPVENSLKIAYKHHVNRRNFKRVYPKPLGDKDSASLYNPVKDKRLRTDLDKMLALWYKGKCLQDLSWCI
uniref:probable tubulin polyglutamylase ttll-15 n=1 Tax=Styela clava TaxID=7725 RepID=UPI00193A8983|nr:probable tubulin polyglutamylase ttll-15 [Styela clava]